MGVLNCEGGHTSRFQYKSLWTTETGHYVEWEIRYYDTVLSGRSNSVRKAYRHAKRAVRREQRMWHFLNPPK